MITQEDRIIINNTEDAVLAEWSCILNCWEWPEGLPDKEDRPANLMKDATPRRDAIMAFIENKIGARIISRTHNKDMTDEEFNDFWTGTYEGDKEALVRHRKRSWEKAKAAYPEE